MDLRVATTALTSAIEQSYRIRLLGIRLPSDLGHGRIQRFTPAPKGG